MFLSNSLLISEFGNHLNLGSDGNVLIPPHNYIVGTLRGTKTKLCSGNKQYPMGCYPNGVWTLKLDDYIDFTWEVSNAQSAELVYAVVPSWSHLFPPGLPLNSLK